MDTEVTVTLLMEVSTGVLRQCGTDYEEIMIIYFWWVEEITL